MSHNRTIRAKVAHATAPKATWKRLKGWCLKRRRIQICTRIATENKATSQQPDSWAAARKQARRQLIHLAALKSLQHHA